MPNIKKFHVTPLSFDQKLVEQVIRRRTNGDSLGTIAKALNVTNGKAAMAELIGTTERVTIDDPAKLARAIAKDRKAGKSWGWLAARYGVTEGTTRAAFTAATGQPFASIDYRKKTADAKAGE
jgi:predicted transcriptional regulator